MRSLGQGKVTVAKSGGTYEISVQGTFGGGYTKRAKQEVVIDETAHALSYALYGRRPVELIAPHDIKSALEQRGYNFSRGQALSVYLPEELIANLKAKAAQERLSVSEIAAVAIRDYLKS